MKKIVPWIVFYAVALGFALLIPFHNPAWMPLIARQALTALNLTVFSYLIFRFVLTPIGSFLDTRQGEIGNELQAAETKIVEAEKLRAEVMKRLNEVETEVSEIKEKAEVQGKAEVERINEQTKNEEERFLKRVNDEIERRQKETRTMLADETAALTAKLARELLAKEMTDADRKKILDKSLTALKAVED